MVENSLGRLWLEGHPNEELQSTWKYYLEEAEQEPEVEEELKKIREEHAKLKPEDIKVLDPCMGSGHILVYAFDVLYEIYKTAGYSEREIPRLILRNNLYGLDIDDRAAQLASFALIMKARHYNRRMFREIEREHLELNLCSIQESNAIGREEIDYFCTLGKGLDNPELRRAMEYLCEVFTDAKEYGSILEVKKINFEVLKDRLTELELENDLMFGDYRATLLEKVPVFIKQAEVMSRLYEVCVTNPPYMGRKGMNVNLINYIDNKFPNSKNDLFSIFIDMCKSKSKIYSAIITQHSWMFLSSFSRLREDIIKNNQIINMCHIGTRGFEELNGEVVQTVSFILSRNKNSNYIGVYKRLINSKNKEEDFLKNDSLIYKFAKRDFNKIPNKAIAYWISNKLVKVFTNEPKMINIMKPVAGISSGNNDKMIRLWTEVSQVDIGVGYHTREESLKSNKKWFFHNKGGEFRKWYGNLENVFLYTIDSIKFMETLPGFRHDNKIDYFRTGLNWAKMSSGRIGVRYTNIGCMFDSAGTSGFPQNNIFYIQGLLNSKISTEIFSILNPTLSIVPGNVADFPVMLDYEKCNFVENIVQQNIMKSRLDWDSFETSWDFKTHPLLKSLDKDKSRSTGSVFSIWETECEENFNQLKSNEEELNRIFIDIYGLQDELTPEVEDKDITIRKADRERDIKSFISYAVGCMFGRYSIDAEGLIYAGGEFNDKWNFDEGKVRKIEKDDEGNIISDSWVSSRFMPYRDNIIPITEDEYFGDDIVSRFIEFVKTVYGNDTLEENLDFIADSIGRKSSETARQAIRRYFIKDFYKDHLKVYQKRPIYWMFESGKNDGFKSLVYMHRYNDQTIAKVRTDYLHTLQRKYESEINRLQLVVDSEEYTAKDRTAAKKKIDRISKQIEECREYDQVVAHLANEKISIDLDDGVKVNYAKFQDVKVINSKGKETKMNLLAKI